MINIDKNKLITLITELSAAEAESLDKVGPITGRLHNVIDDICNLLSIPNIWEIRTDEENRTIKTKSCPSCHCAIIE